MLFCPLDDEIDAKFFLDVAFLKVLLWCQRTVATLQSGGGVVVYFSMRILGSGWLCIHRHCQHLLWSSEAVLTEYDHQENYGSHASQFSDLSTTLVALL